MYVNELAALYCASKVFWAELDCEKRWLLAEWADMTALIFTDYIKVFYLKNNFSIILAL